MTLNFHCEQCRTHRPVEIEPIEADDMTPFAWGDIVCKRCHFVIATMSASERGRLVFVTEEQLAVLWPSRRCWQRWRGWQRRKRREDWTVTSDADL